MICKSFADAAGCGRKPNYWPKSLWPQSRRFGFIGFKAALPAGSNCKFRSWGTAISLGPAFILLAILVIVGTSNAVNLTDGLDGLAGGCLITTTGAVAIMTYVAGHFELANYLGVTHLPEAGEAVVVAGAMIGGTLGFLWFNCQPAQVFMGDTGALALGGTLGLLALIARQELLLLVAGGVFVAEAVSVMLQIASSRLLGRRVFRCAPLHHHFQFLGWAENKIVTRFWIVSMLCAVISLGAMKINHGDDMIHPSSPQQDAASQNPPAADRANLPIAQACQSSIMNESALHIVFAGGGTAGHLFPGFAVAQELAVLVDPPRITFAAGGKSLESKLIASAGFDCQPFPCAPLPQGVRGVLPFLAQNLAGYRRARRWLRREHADAVVGLGGYVSVPICRAAIANGLPLVLLEQNAIPGRATRWLAKRADLVCSTFDDART